MKHSALKVGVEYAVTRSRYNADRVRVVEVDDVARKPGRPLTREQFETSAKGTTKHLDVAEGVGYVYHGGFYGSGHAKGAYAVLLDNETGDPKALDDGSLHIRFYHSRQFDDIFDNYVEAQRLLDLQRQAENDRRAIEREQAHARRVAIIERIDALALVSLDSGERARAWDSKINGMWLHDWERLLDRVDEITEGAK